MEDHNLEELALIQFNYIQKLLKYILHYLEDKLIIHLKLLDKFQDI
jgi:hypothetical protein